MSSATLRFYSRAQSKLRIDSELPEYFVYYLTVECGEEVASTKAIENCYLTSDLAVPSWLPSLLSKGLTSKPKRFVKRDGGYRLESKRRTYIALTLGDDRPVAQTSAALSKLEALIPGGYKRDFLHETIICFNAGANRAAVVMCWNLAVHHLQDHIMVDPARHAAFNVVLANNKDSRVKVKAITKQDDFTEMPEGKFLEFCREAKVITSTIFNKLKGRLDERNGAAHPSGVRTTPKAAEVYIEDLVENVLTKYTS